MLAKRNFLAVRAWSGCFRRALASDRGRAAGLLTRRDASRLYPGPQASLKNISFLPGSTSETFPESLNGPREDFPVFYEASKDASLTPNDWGKVCREKLDKLMPANSAFAFRGLPLDSAESFNEFLDGCSYGRLSYVGGSGVREKVHSLIYNSTVEPPEYNIELHNEMSYSPIYNHKIVFCCITAPAEGGGGISAICNNRDIFKEIDPHFIENLREKGILYIRNTIKSSVPGTPSWQNIFETSSRKEAEEVMASRSMKWKWLEGDKLRFWYKLGAFTLHPETGEELWFNQIHSHHVSYYQAHPDFLDEGLSNYDYPFHCTYGDGGEFEPELLQKVREASWRHAVGFPWQQGDVIVLDNMVAQHSRLSYTGPRKILVGLSSARTGQAYHGHREEARM